MADTGNAAGIENRESVSLPVAIQSVPMDLDRQVNNESPQTVVDVGSNAHSHFDGWSSVPAASWGLDDRPEQALLGDESVTTPPEQRELDTANTTTVDDIPVQPSFEPISGDDQTQQGKQAMANENPLPGSELMVPSEGQRPENAHEDAHNIDDDDAAAAADNDGDGDGTAPNVPNTDHFVWVDRGDAMEESSSCKLCMIDPDAMDALYLECGHVWCKDCINHYFAQVFTDRDSFPPRCCRQVGFSLDNIQMYLEDEILIHVMEKWEEWSAEDPTYCSNIQCRAFVSADRVQGQWAICLLCKVKTCVECKAKAARHPSPEQHPEPTRDRENTELAQKEGWKYCPNSKCNKLVEKIDGCDTMTCKCGQQFCYRCGNSFDEPFPCTCDGHNAWVGEVQAWAAGADEDEQGGRESESDNEEDENGRNENDQGGRD